MLWGRGGGGGTSRTRTRRWKVSLPAFLAMYLLAAMRPASRDSDDSCSFSQLRSGTFAINQETAGRASCAAGERGGRAAYESHAMSPAGAVHIIMCAM